MNKDGLRFVLFDMDSTLIKVSRWHGEAYQTTLREVYGLDAATLSGHGSQSGNTQPNIIRAGCRIAGLDEQVIEEQLPAAIGMLSATLIRILPHDLRRLVLPGVFPLLDALSEEGHALALVTGTLTASTRIILERSGLSEYFPVCACGDERSERVDLVRLAIERAAERYELTADGHGLSVVGDAPRDIQAGREVQAWVVAVATGAFDVKALARHNPDVVLPNLADWRGARRAILDGSRTHRVPSL